MLVAPPARETCAHEFGRHPGWAVLWVCCVLVVLIPALSGAEGGLDHSFGDRGVAALTGCGDQVNDLALSSDGKIVFAGQTVVNGRGATNWSFGRLLPDGSPDPQLRGDGCSGIARLSFEGGAPSGLVVHPDGRFTMAGGDAFGVTLIGHVEEGDLDPAFGVEGLFSPADFGLPQRGLQAVALDGEERLVTATAGDEILVARHWADGLPDQTFGVNGFVSVPAGDVSQVTDLVIQSDGGLLLSARASVTQVAPLTGFVLVRLLPDGALDVDFGEGGIVTTAFDGLAAKAEDIVPYPDGGFVVVGRSFRETARGVFRAEHFLAAFYDAQGNLDPSFGAEGTLVVRGRSGTRDPYAAAIAGVRQRDGKLVMVGSDGRSVYLVRVDSSGRPDRRFGRRGVLTARMPGDHGDLLDAELQDDGRLVVAGYRVDYRTSLGRAATLMRFLLEGSPGRRAIAPRRTRLPALRR